jgi:hypothetical protein
MATLYRLSWWLLLLLVAVGSTTRGWCLPACLPAALDFTFQIYGSNAFPWKWFGVALMTGVGWTYVLCACCVRVCTCVLVADVCLPDDVYVCKCARVAHSRPPQLLAIVKARAGAVCFLTRPTLPTHPLRSVSFVFFGGHPFSDWLISPRSFFGQHMPVSADYMPYFNAVLLVTVVVLTFLYGK